MTGVLDTFGLDGRVVVITGASSGLGAAVALAVAQAGADVVIGARRRELLEATAATVEGIGRKALVVPTDITLVEGSVIATTISATVTLGSTATPSPLTITSTGVVRPTAAGATGVISDR